MENKIGEIISRERQNRRMTQEEFASRLGVTPQAVSKWEREMSLPDVSIVTGICQVLKISANELFGIAPEERISESNDKARQEEIRSNLHAEPLLLEFGSELIPVVVAGLETDQVHRTRVDLAKRTGMWLPIFRLRDNVALSADEMRICIYDKVVYQGNVGLTADQMNGQETFAKMLEKLSAVCEEHYDLLLNKQIVKVLVDNVRENFSGVVENVFQEKISYLTLELVLKEIVRKKKNIRDIIHILELTEREMLLNNVTDPESIAENIMEEL